MNNDDLGRFSKVMYVIGENYNQAITDTKLKTFYTLLTKYDIEDIEIGLMRLIQERKYNTFPNLAEMIEFIDNKDNLDTRIELQCDIVLNAIQRIGGYRDIKFKDSITNVIVHQMGWTKICSSLTDESIKWFRKDFYAQYKSFKINNISNDSVNFGTNSISNGANNREINNNYIEFIEVMGLNDYIINRRLVELEDKSTKGKENDNKLKELIKKIG